jgi:methionyl-tRNA formyltransferase
VNSRFNVIFMGTPDFAVPSLQVLAKAGCDVSLVVTQPDRPRGRGRKSAPPPVKVAAEALGYEVIQPETIRSDAFVETVRDLRPDLLVVVAFGRILPKTVLEIPVFGAVNVHASLLPKYRGPAPIQWAVIAGETVTGVTTMLMDKGLDTGEILMQSVLDISPDDTAGDLHDRLAVAGGDLLAQTIEGFSNNTIRPTPQDHARATYAPMLSKADGHIDWTCSAEIIERFVRGMTPWPGAFTFLDQKRLIISKTALRAGDPDALPGTVLPGFANEIRIATGGGKAVAVLEIQEASGKRMPIDTYLKGRSVSAGAVLR